ncbi:MAG: Asp-tRNA(Asn)/Glu-tRNA(Gln) amidotransferase GatCAB subunit B [Myxococcales bacterium]|nr:Asp-tRNA(Asn)/Glu-tRNA(Gln) amidotransferase GatCAB subunit B [Myxococcales bacterium]
MESILERWEPVIGLEVHAQLKTRTKIFCGCPTNFGGEPNTHVCPVCLGHPGTLPVLNQSAVKMAIATGLGLHCTVTTESVFARKNYFYPDLPKGYQISQFDKPICTEGWLEIVLPERTFRAGIERVHMEEDAGKNLHDAQTGLSQVDFNRTGVPLVEIVGKPDLHSAEEAMAYLKELRNILRYLDVCDGNLEEGSFRCDANVSIRPSGTEPLGTRVEIKNINSFRNVGRALGYEIRRQARALESGDAIVLETRLFDADTGQTQSMRSKEESADYRYFPDPDLLPLRLDQTIIEEVRSTLPPLPEDVRSRFNEQYGLRPYDIAVLTDEKDLALFYEEIVTSGADALAASKWVQTEVLGRLSGDKLTVSDCPVPPERIARLLTHQSEGRITGKMAKDIFEKMWREDADPDKEVEQIGGVISDDADLRRICGEIATQFPDETAQFLAGKTKVLGFLMGQLMRQTKGKADPKKASKLLRETLEAIGTEGK